MSLGALISSICSQVASLVGSFPFVGTTLAAIVNQICSLLVSLVGGST
ncbi:MAG: hypothetical protein U1A27_02640 [Phycisphaerae bacterium]